MEQALLVWALWVTAGGRVNSGYLQQPYIAAYLATQDECARVQELINQQSKWSRCIQARYIINAPPR